MRLEVEHPRSDAFLVAMCQDCLLKLSLCQRKDTAKPAKGQAREERLGNQAQLPEPELLACVWLSLGGSLEALCVTLPGTLQAVDREQLAVEPHALSAHIWAHQATLSCRKVFRPRREFLPARLRGARWARAGQVSVIGQGGVGSGLQPHHRGFVHTGHTLGSTDGQRWC